ncbi:hypothetical protein PFAG_00685 [Plasmodium falciparum Santa Lucia]|uniref:LITAF domain-containing protein n=1 Tax=Plasmodium falciparum Santa Lucia TaxID=478859 RepID=W7G460_PLAFA|nr:hypothetical protein PFAG_00685 [Plasmodium falciparum Santa Lucia]
MTGFNGKDQLTEMNVLQNEMKDININDSIHNEDSNIKHNIYNNEMINSNNNNNNNNNIYNDHNNNSHMYNNIYKNNSYNDGNSTCSGNNNTYNENNFLNDRGEEDEDYYYNNNNNNINNNNINNNNNNINNNNYISSSNNYNNNYISSSNNYNNKSPNEVKEILNCDYCNKHVYPLIKTYTPLFVYIMIIILFVFISFFTIFLLPLLYLTFKQKKYICPYCEKNLTSSEKLFKVKRENQILTFQFPKCAIIISAKYLALFLSLIFLIFFFYIIRITSHFNLDNFVKGPYITSSWIDYLEDCGNKSQFRNKFNSIHNFKKLYYSNTVLWRGNFFQIKEGFLNSNSLYIKMNPSEYKYDRPDIRALFNNNLISQIENLQKNDYIEFECTLIEISKNKSPHLCLLWNVKLIEKYQPKNLSMVDFVKHLSILDMINSHANPNPFFINLNNKDSDAPASIKILHFSSNGFNEPNIIHTNDPYMLNIMEREHMEPNMKFGHLERKSLPFFDDEEEEDEQEDEQEEEEREGDNEDGHPYEFNQYEEPFINDPDDDINIFDDTMYAVPRNVSSFNHNSETFKNDMHPYEYEVSSMYDRDVREEKGQILKDNEHDNKRDNIKDNEHDNIKDNNIKDNKHDHNQANIKDSVPLNGQTGVSNDTPQNLSSDASKSVPKDVQNKVKNEKTQTKQIKKKHTKR